MILFKKYATALLSLFVIVVGALQAAMLDNVFAPDEGGQLLALTAFGVVTFIVPLTAGLWAGVLKTGASVVGAVATLVVPLILNSGELSAQNWIIIVAAIINALATELGVQIRKDPLIDARNTNKVTSLP